MCDSLRQRKTILTVCCNCYVQPYIDDSSRRRSLPAPRTTCSAVTSNPIIAASAARITLEGVGSDTLGLDRECSGANGTVAAVDARGEAADACAAVVRASSLFEGKAIVGLKGVSWCGAIGNGEGLGGCEGDEKAKTVMEVHDGGSRCFLDNDGEDATLCKRAEDAASTRSLCKPEAAPRKRPLDLGPKAVCPS
jgi:hypothetical protein